MHSELSWLTPDGGTSRTLEAEGEHHAAAGFKPGRGREGGGGAGTGPPRRVTAPHSDSQLHFFYPDSAKPPRPSDSKPPPGSVVRPAGSDYEKQRRKHAAAAGVVPPSSSSSGGPLGSGGRAASPAGRPWRMGADDGMRQRPSSARMRQRRDASLRSHRENFNAGQNKRDLPGDGGTFDSEGFVDEILDRSKLGLSLAQRKKAEERVKLPEKPALTHIYGEDDFLLRTDAGLGEFDPARYKPVDPRKYTPEQLAVLRASNRKEMEKLERFFVLDSDHPSNRAEQIELSDSMVRGGALQARAEKLRDEAREREKHDPKRTLLLNEDARPLVPEDPSYDPGQEDIPGVDFKISFSKHRTTGRTGRKREVEEQGGGDEEEVVEQRKMFFEMEQDLGGEGKKLKAPVYPPHHEYSFENTQDVVDYKFDPEAGADPPDLVRRNIVGQAVFAHGNRAELWLEQAEKAGVDLFARPEGEYPRPFEAN
eukprot:CAMPEP_0179006754 /NCGR_PEP_ID=MMETSP0795-20121207/14740_1 /TAXON_ID=88552 /ORGANISM="Amoebophrya sp., Strain Ameob2" /LENGTH=479 /DNA_ID=CAMNT_0020701571 /DNA_START=134 /DNA_END=1573 /DNA_ORIENTATION=-